MTIKTEKYLEKDIKPAAGLGKMIVRFVIDPYIIMLCVGALGHRLELEQLFLVGFLESLLLVLIAQALAPTVIDRWKFKEEKVVQEAK